MNNIPNIFATALQSLEDSSESSRLQLYRDLKIFYENDNDEIETYLKNKLINLGLFKKETTDKLFICHRDNIQKSLKRVTAGIFDNRPVRELWNGDNLSDFDLAGYLDSINYNAKVKEIFKKARYYGIAEMYIQFIDGKPRLEVIVPDRYLIETKSNDYLKKEKIYIQKSRLDSNGEFELIYEVWTDYDYSILLSNNVIEQVEINGELKKTQPNKYKKIPVVCLRFNEGDSYFSEPNWDLFSTQIKLDIMRTNDFYTSLFQKFGVGIAVNLGLKENDTIAPNKILKVDNVKEGDVLPDLKFVTPDNDWEGYNKAIDFEVLDSLRSQGINTNSASLDNKTLSGTAKTIDEIELIEERENVKEVLYNFEIELLNLIKTIQNAEKKLIPEGDFEVTYSEEQTVESIDDKIKRREMELKYGIKSPIDFIKEDLEVSQGEAELIYKENKENKEYLNSETKNNLQNNSENNSETNLQNNG